MLHATTGRRCIQRYTSQKSKNQDTTAVCDVENDSNWYNSHATLGFMFFFPSSMIRTHKPEKPFPHYNRKQMRTDIMFLLINSQLLPISLPSTVAASGHYPPKSQHLATYTYYMILGASGSLLGLCLRLGAPSTPYGLLPIASLPHKRQTLHKVSLSR